MEGYKTLWTQITTDGKARIIKHQSGEISPKIELNHRGNRERLITLANTMLEEVLTDKSKSYHKSDDSAAIPPQN